MAIGHALVACHGFSHAQPTNVTNLSINAHHLAVVSLEQPQWLGQAERAERTNPDSCTLQLDPQRPAGAQAAQPVEEYEDLDAGAGSLHQRFGDIRCPNAIRAKDV